MLLPTPSLLTATKATTSPLSKNASLKRSAPKFLSFIFQSNPGPVNCCTLLPTKEYLANPSHPFHIRAKRSIAAFDASKFHWTVSAPIDVAKKKVVRSWVIRRVRVAVKEELKAKGWRDDGMVIETQGAGGEEGVKIHGMHGKLPLRGALKIFPTKDRRQDAITATGEEVRENVRAILGEVIRRQPDSRQKTRTQGIRRNRSYEKPIRRSLQVEETPTTRPLATADDLQVGEEQAASR